MTTRRQFLSVFGATTCCIAMGMTPALADGHGKIGNFEGRSDHITTGRAEVTKNEVVLLDDFSLDGAPTPRVGFGKDGKYDPNTDLGALGNLTGKQSYKIPAGVNTDDYNEVYIWCKKFNVPLGVAKFQ